MHSFMYQSRSMITVPDPLSAGFMIMYVRECNQSRTQSPWAFWTAVKRSERLWDNGLELFFGLLACVTMAV